MKLFLNQVTFILPYDIYHLNIEKAANFEFFMEKWKGVESENDVKSIRVWNI